MKYFLNLFRQIDMKRTNFAFTLLFSLLLCSPALLAESKQSAKKVVINWPIHHDPVKYFESVALHFKKEVEEKTQGRISVNVITDPNNPLTYNKRNVVTNGSEKDMRMLIEGTEVQMSQVYTDVLTELEPRFQVFDLPYMFKSHEHVTRVVEGEIGKDLLASLDSKGLKALGFTYSGGFIGVATTGPEIHKYEDFKNLNLRVADNPIMQEAADKLQSYSFSVVHRGKRVNAKKLLEAGVINAAEVTYNDADIAFFEPKKNHATVLNDTQHRVLLSTIIMSKKVFNSLSKQDQKTVEQVGFAVSRMERAKIVEDSKTIINKIKDKGYKVVPMTVYEQMRMQEFLSPINTKYEKIIGKDLIDQIKELGKDIKRQTLASF